MTALLEIDDLHAGYGRGLVLRGTTLRVEEGAVTCLIGPNGAGKSTVLKAVSGLLAPRSGRIVFRGKDVGGRSPQDVLRLGIVHVPQERSLFPLMTVWDNVLMGGFIHRDRAALHRRIGEVAERFPIVAERRHDRAGSLSGGEQKRVEIARAFMLEPSLVLMDEPSTGLDPNARRAVFATISEINEAGTTVLLVEQNARSGLAVAHRGAVMESGVVRLEGTGRALLDDPEVARLYLGAASQGARRT
ncbi:MAG TPA: ABC transporter ATP-binding protein [Actinomycetota bacterium]|nr:ABC transporter ATP-binding protein [Actinomycetota bacterium]